MLLVSPAGGGLGPIGEVRCRPLVPTALGEIELTANAHPATMALASVRPIQQPREPLPGAVHGEPGEAAQVGALVSVARRALDAGPIGAVAVRFRVREEHRGTIATDQ